MTSYITMVRGNEQDPTNAVTKSLGNWWRYERFDVVYSVDWCSVCHFDVAFSHRENRGSTTIMQNRDTNLESWYDCHSRTGGLRGESITGGNKDSRNRIESNRCFRPAQYDGFDATTEYSFIFCFFFFFTPPHTAAAAMFKRSVEYIFPSLFQIEINNSGK